MSCSESPKYANHDGCGYFVGMAIFLILGGALGCFWGNEIGKVRTYREATTAGAAHWEIDKDGGKPYIIWHSTQEEVEDGSTGT